MPSSIDSLCTCHFELFIFPLLFGPLNMTFPLAEILFSIFFLASLSFKLNHYYLVWVGLLSESGRGREGREMNQWEWFGLLSLSFSVLWLHKPSSPSSVSLCLGLDGLLSPSSYSQQREENKVWPHHSEMFEQWMDLGSHGRMEDWHPTLSTNSSGAVIKDMAQWYRALNSRVSVLALS